MNSLIKRDNNEIRYNALFLLQKEGNPDYYKVLIRNARAFFYGMRREDLIISMDKFINKKIEKKVGRDINSILWIYRYMTNVRQFTINKFSGEYVYMSQLNKYFDELEKWVFQNAVILEDQIRFTLSAKQWA